MTDLAHPQPVLDEADEPFQPYDTVSRTIRTTLTTGSAGLLVSAVQNTLSRQNVGPFGIVTRYGVATALFASVGGTWAFVSSASANLREKRDPYNDAIGGFFAGMYPGLFKRSMAAALGSGATLATILFTVNYAGANVFGDHSRNPDDPIAEKDAIRKRFRRPLNETVNEIGEGRGIYPPGYEERRKQRIKERYGIEIQEPYYNQKSAGNAT